LSWLSRAATLGVKGHRPVVGTRDCKDLLYVLAVINVVTGTLHANTLESPAKAKRMTGQGKTRRMQEAFASHLRHIGRLYPATPREHGIHPTAVIAPTAQIGDGAAIGPHVSIGDGAQIGSGVTIRAGVRIENSVIGKNCKIDEGAHVVDSVIWSGTTISSFTLGTKSTTYAEPR